MSDVSTVGVNNLVSERIVNETFTVIDKSKLEKLQESNRIMREALESIATDTVEVGFYIEPTWTAQVAREALKKAGEL